MDPITSVDTDSMQRKESDMMIRGGFGTFYTLLEQCNYPQEGIDRETIIFTADGILHSKLTANGGRVIVLYVTCHMIVLLHVV